MKKYFASEARTAAFSRSDQGNLMILRRFLHAETRNKTHKT
jgi:hypothetical protein